MKISIFLILASAISLQASSVFSQNKKMTVDMQNVTVREVIHEIEKQGGISFLFNDNLQELNRHVSVSHIDQPLQDVLYSALDQADMMYEEVGENFLVLLPKPDHIIKQQEITVTGQVMDASTGQPLPGASIIVRGTTIGTTTGVDGDYTLSVPSRDVVLVFSFVGYVSREILVGENNVIDINLEEEIRFLDEIVVIGYGTARRSEVSGAVGIATAEDLSRQTSVNVLQSLAGKIPGVTIFTNSGQPGGNTRVVIRGMGTINAATAPLYVLDGVQVTNIKDLNPNDIKSIEVLKDASSAAIYGARGANGVVLISTLRGLEEEGVTVEYRSYFSAGQIRRKSNDMYRPMNSEEFMEVQRISYENAPYFRTYAPGREPQLILNNELLFDSQGNPIYDTDWEKEVTRTAYSNNHQINIRYGTENTSTGFFVNFTDQNGIYLNSWMKRANARVTFDATPRQWFSVGGNLSMRRIWENEPHTVSGGVRATTRMIFEYPPIFPVKWPDGTYSHSAETSGTSMSFEVASNPVAGLLENIELHDRNNLHGNVYVDFHITDNIYLKSQFGFDNNLNKFRRYYPTFMRGSGFPDGRAEISNSTNTFWQNENYLSYDNRFGSHNIKMMLGASWQQFMHDNSWQRNDGFKTDFYKFNNVGVSERFSKPNSDAYDWSMNSYFFRGTYTYDSKYTLNFTGRYDGSSRFGRESKYAFFPSIGISWLISEEDFMSGIGFIDWARLRVSYGVTGNSEIGLYNSMATIGSGTTLIGGALASTSFPTRIANTGLKWERSQQTNIGLEVQVFNNNISLEVDYYDKLTTDLLLVRPIPSHTGFTSIRDNIGSVSNKGVDLMISTRNINSPRFTWTTSFSVNYNKNVVEKLGEHDEDIFPGPSWVAGSQTVLRVGEPLVSFWGLVREGVYNTDEAMEAAEVGKLPGMIKRRLGGEIIGNGMPDYVGSFLNQLRFGNFDAIIDLQFTYGVEILQQFVCTAEDRQALMNGMKTQLYQSWTPDNQDTSIPMIRNTNISGQDLAVDSHWVCDGSFIRGRLFSVGYTFDNVKIRRLGVNNLRINASLENAFVINSDEFKGYDPESDGHYGGSNFGQNIFFYQYPKPRTFSLGLNLQF